jgi:hypothetical protein
MQDTATHLTVHFGGDIKADDVQNYCHKAGQTRKGVYLPKGADQSQDPAWAMKPKKSEYGLQTHIVQR